MFLPKLKKHVFFCEIQNCDFSIKLEIMPKPKITFFTKIRKLLLPVKPKLCFPAKTENNQNQKNCIFLAKPKIIFFSTKPKSYFSAKPKLKNWIFPPKLEIMFSCNKSHFLAKIEAELVFFCQIFVFLFSLQNKKKMYFPVKIGKSRFLVKTKNRIFLTQLENHFFSSKRKIEFFLLKSENRFFRQYRKPRFRVKIKWIMFSY